MIKIESYTEICANPIPTTAESASIPRRTRKTRIKVTVNKFNVNKALNLKKKIEKVENKKSNNYSNYSKKTHLSNLNIIFI